MPSPRDTAARPLPPGTATGAYRRPPARPGPPPGVDLWLIPLDAAPGARVTAPAGRQGDAGRPVGGLGRAERSRALSLRDPATARRYVAAHTALRTLLGRYVGRPGSTLRWATGRHGKPVFEGELHSWHWSLSRSASHALLAVSRTAPVGVDIERITVPPRAVTPLAARFLPPAEAALVAAQPGTQARRAAYHGLLSRKESCVKAVGGRFSEGLRLPVATPGPVAPHPDALGGSGDGGDVARWLVDLPAPAGYVASLATVGRSPLPLRLFAWSAPGERPTVADLGTAPERPRAEPAGVAA